MSLAAGTWTEVTGCEVTLGVGTWLVIGQANISNNGSNNAKYIGICDTTPGATIQATATQAASALYDSLAAIVEVTSGTKKILVGVYNNVATTVSNGNITALKLF